MRKKIVAGNWKMNKTFAEGVELAREVNDYVRYKEGGEGSSCCSRYSLYPLGKSGS